MGGENILVKQVSLRYAGLLDGMRERTR